MYFVPALADWTGTHFFKPLTVQAIFACPVQRSAIVNSSGFEVFCSCLNLHAAFTQPGALIIRSLYMLSVAFFYKTRLKGGLHKYCNREFPLIVGIQIILPGNGMKHKKSVIESRGVPLPARIPQPCRPFLPDIFSTSALLPLPVRDLPLFVEGGAARHRRPPPLRPPMRR